MKDIIIDGIIDTLKVFPFLLFVFIILEYYEHHMNEKNANILKKTKRGPIIGSFLGAIPQCGFSVAATNLFSARAISLGTLISIYLSTSDEMLFIMISEKVKLLTILSIIGIKVIIGLICGILIDRFYSEKKNIDIKNICSEDHCGCEEKSIIKSALKHTSNITLFILIFTILLNIMFYLIGEANISKIFINDNFSPFLTSLIGLIPNCASSVIITELYLKKVIMFGTMISGLLTNSGIAFVVLFKENKNILENIKILSIVYFIGVIVGIIINIIG